MTDLTKILVTLIEKIRIDKQMLVKMASFYSSKLLILGMLVETRKITQRKIIQRFN